MADPLAGLDPETRARLRSMLQGMGSRSIAAAEPLGAVQGGQAGRFDVGASNPNLEAMLGGARMGFAPSPEQYARPTLEQAPTQQTNVAINAPGPLPQMGTVSAQTAGGALPGEGTPEEQAYMYQNAIPGIADGLSQLRPNATLGETFNAMARGYLGGMGQVKGQLRQDRRQAIQDEQTVLNNALQRDTIKQKQEGMRAAMERIDQIAQTDPERAANMRLMMQVDPSSMGDLLIPKSKTTVLGAGQVLIDEATGKPIAQGPPETLTPYQQAQLGISQAELDLRRQQLAQEGGTKAPELVTIDDYNNPGQSIMVDKRTGQPWLVNGRPARPASSREAGSAFNQAKDLRTSYEKLVSDAVAAATAYRKVEAGFAEDSGAGDIAGIFGYMKMLDPISVVREGEQANAENAGGVAESVRNLYNKTLRGERLTPRVREEMKKAAGSQMGAYKKRYEEVGQTYTGLANNFGIPPEQVVIPVEFPDVRSESEKAAATATTTIPPPPPGGSGAGTAPPAPGSNIYDEAAKNAAGIVPRANAAAPGGAAAPSFDPKKAVMDVFGP